MNANKTTMSMLLAGLLFVAGPATAEVLSELLISDGLGGFGGALDPDGAFGRDLILLGDLDDDGVDDFAVGASVQDATGVVWILFLNSDGTVKAEQKIAEGVGGFMGGLDAGDGFGHAVAALGDLNEDGVEDLAVGAWGDDDAGENAGAVWMLFLDTDGTVQSHRKIDYTTGDLPYQDFPESDWFGDAVAAIEDLDGDGVVDLAIGAPNRGALFILFLDIDGSAKGHQEVSSEAGGFWGQLGSRVGFGGSVTAIGDLNGDGTTDLAVGAPGVGGYRGEVWIVFLEPNGTVNWLQKIDDANGGLNAQFNFATRFGYELDWMEDPTCGGGTLAVGEIYDEPPVYRAGAIWLLKLRADGMVLDQDRITPESGHLQNPPGQGTYFSVPASRGDPNGDGVADLAVGAFRQRVGNEAPGGVWMLELSNGRLDRRQITFARAGSGVSRDESFTVSNAGCTPISGNVVSPCADFVVIAGEGPFTLNGGESVLVTVRFAPTSVGLKSCSISIGADFPDFPVEGTAADCDIVPTLVDFDLIPLGESSDLPFSITNLSASAINGDLTADCPEFEIIDGAGPFTLNTGETLDATARFTAPGGPQSICVIPIETCGAVLLLGETAPCLLSTSVLDFGQVIVGDVAEQSLTIKNVGGVTLVGNAYIPPGCTDFTSSHGYWSLGPGDSLVVTVTYAPGEEGLDQCELWAGETCGDVALVGWGVPELRITSVTDVGFDQGGQVRVQWLRAPDDAPLSPVTPEPVVSYEIHRRMDVIPKRVYEVVGTSPAHGEPAYSLVVPTVADDVWTVFFVRGLTDDPGTFFDSPPDSGFSVDNIEPGLPPVLTVTYGDGRNELTWQAPDDGDVAGYRIYRGSTPGFEVGSANLLAVTAATAWADARGRSRHHYRVAAVDHSGNEGKAAVATTSRESVPTQFALHRNIPNPFNPATTLRFDVPDGGGTVTLRVYDVRGQAVKTLVDGYRPAGRHSVMWRGVDDRGMRVSSGVYFLRLQTPGYQRTIKATLIE